MRQVLRAGVLGRPRGMGWRGRWERGSGWGKHVNPWLIHVNVWQKPLQYCKVISLQLIKINEKKKKKKVKEESEKVGLKLNIQKTKIMVSGPITSWQIDAETVADFILGGSNIPTDGDCSHEIKRHLLLRMKVMTNVDSISKSRDIILPTRVHLDKAMVFPVVMNGCESWTIKKAEC